MPRFVLRLLGLLALTLLASPVLAASALHFSGEVTYRERIALPPNAILRVALVDMTTSDNHQIVAATANIGREGQVPLAFDLSVISGVLSPTGHYGLVAEISADGRIWFRSMAPQPIDPANPSALLFIVGLLGQNEAVIAPTSKAAPAELAVSGELFDTLWRVSTIAGNAVRSDTTITLSIASDRRAGGNGGCNNYFTEASLDAARLTFGALAATRMSCAPNVMAQEAALFAALANATSYELGDGQLQLLGPDGKPLLVLAPAD